MDAPDERRRAPWPLWVRSPGRVAVLLLAMVATALAVRPAVAEARRPANPPVAGVSSLRDLAAWVAARAEAARRRVAELDEAERARAAEQALATARLAAALQRNGSLLAAKRALEADARRARAGRDDAEAAARRLGRPAAAGLLALAARGRPEAQPPRSVARLRAVVGGLLEPYAEKSRQGWTLGEDASRLAGEARGLDAALSVAGAGLAGLNERLLATREAARSARRERGLALARRDALARQLAAIEGRGRAAAEASGLGDGTGAAPGPRPRPPRAGGAGGASLVAELARPPEPRALVAGARAAPPRPAATAAGPAAVAFGPDRPADATPPAGPLFAPIAGRPVPPGDGGGELFRRGLLLETGVAQTVSAPCRGEVVFADRFGSFGLLLIIDRGDGYHALLSGLSRLAVGRGASLMAGQAVGEIGVGDGSGRLYVELRRRGSPVDPSAWPALREDKVRS